MEWIVLAVILVAILLAGAIAGLLAISRVAALTRELAGLRSRLQQFATEIRRLEERLLPLGHRPDEEKVRPFVPPLPAPAEKPFVPTPIAVVAAQTDKPVLQPAAALAVVAAASVHSAAKESAAYEGWHRIEQSVGKRWITWVGALVLVVGAALFVKYAFEQDWLGPVGRVVAGMVTGLAAVGAGARFLHRSMRPLGQGLIGAGLGILYTVSYAGFGYYQIFSAPVALALLVTVTVGGMTLAVIYDALPIALLAVLGGFLTPVLVGTGDDPRDRLFAYLLLLDLGTFAVAFFRRWRILDILALGATWAYFGGWHAMYGRPEMVVGTTVWLSVFFLVFLVQPFVFHLRFQTPITVERFAASLSNATAVFGYAVALLQVAHPLALGLFLLAMSVTYAAFGILVRRRIPLDGRSLFGFVTLSMALLTLVSPLLFELHTVTAAWAVQSVVLLLLGFRFGYLPVRVGALASFGLAIGYLFRLDWSFDSPAFRPVFNPAFGTAWFVVLAGAIATWLHFRRRAAAGLPDRWLQRLIGLTSTALALVAVHVELWRMLCAFALSHHLNWVASLDWLAGGLGLMLCAWRLRAPVVRGAAMFALAVAVVLLGADYAEALTHWPWPFANGRFLAATALCAAVFTLAWLSLRMTDRRAPQVASRLPALLYGSGILLVTGLLTAEIWPWLADRGQFYLGRWLLALIWGLGAGGYLLAAVRLQDRDLALAGLCIHAVAIIFAAMGYSAETSGRFFLFLNGRFAAVLFVVLMTAVHAFGLHRWGPSPLHGRSKTPLAGLALGLFWIFASIEIGFYFKAAIPDAARASVAAHMGLSVLWGLYALALLALGFWRRVRPLRLAALGLFGLTALKLAIFDLAGIGEVYRIVSFIGLGLLMIGASYLYHRIEKRLE